MTDTNDSVVKTIKLTKIFRDFWLRNKVSAVADLDLDILPHEVFGLLGPNGSGKSTTLKMILGLLFPTRGRVTVFGRKASDVQVKSRIGFLPEESYLYPFLDAYETLDFYGRLFHQNRAQRRRRIEMLLDMVGLTSVAYRRVGEYSKGMQRRIGLAQALINDPDLLILDEPTSGMDPIGTRQIKDLIRTLAERGKTVLLSSHLLADVEDVCDRVCILYGGRSRQMGSVGDLLSRQGLTELTTDHLDEATLAKVQEVLSKSNREILKVSAPRDKLETLFLRIVEEAQSQRLVTGGSISGGKVAEFLRADQPTGRAVIEELVAKTVTEPAPLAQEPQQAPAEEPSADVLDDLITAGDNEPAAPEKIDEPQPPKSKPTQDQANRSVIDDLVGGDSSDRQEP